MDVYRNQPDYFKALFSSDNRSYLEDLYRDVLRQLKGVPLDECEDVFKALYVVAVIVGNALWRYDCDVGPMLKSFVREFDRMDDPGGRRRLYDLAQRQ